VQTGETRVVPGVSQRIEPNPEGVELSTCLVPHMRPNGHGCDDNIRILNKNYNDIHARCVFSPVRGRAIGLIFALAVPRGNTF